MPQPASHDSAYKRLFSHPELVRDLLVGFVQEDWVAELDFSTLERANGSYVSQDLREREDDIIWKVKRQGHWLYIYLLIEFQSSIDWWMAVRLQVYLGLLYQDLITTLKLKPGDLLPPVLPIVLYNGSSRWRAPECLDALIHAAPGSLQRYRPQLHYLLLDEGAHAACSTAELEASRNVVAALFQLENSRTEEDMIAVIGLLLEWLQAPEQHSLSRELATWLNQVLLPRKSGVDASAIPTQELYEVRQMLRERVQEWVQPWVQQGEQRGFAKGKTEGEQLGLAKGEQLGLAKGRERVLRRLLHLKFGSDLPDWAEAKLATADSDTLELWAERVLTEATLEAVLGLIHTDSPAG